MANNPETLFGMFQKYATQKKTTFKDWCAFIAWVRKCKPNVNILNTLDVLSPEAYEKAVNPKAEPPADPPADPPAVKDDKELKPAEAETPAETVAPSKPTVEKKKKPVPKKEE